MVFMKAVKSPSMATHIILSLTIFILSIISANGRSTKLKAVSRATSDSYITNYNDVLGLGILVNQYASVYNLLNDNADPCAPPVWDWIVCNNDSTPRVIALNLHNVGLYDIPNDFSTLDALQIIDLSQTGLDGTIPSFFATFPVLQELNLTVNALYGKVPASLCDNKKLKLTLFGNPKLSTCSSSSSPSNASPSPPADLNTGGSSGGQTIPPTTPKKKSNTPQIVGGTISAFLVMFIGVGAFAVHRQKARSAAAVAHAHASAGPTDPKAKIPMDEAPILNDDHNANPTAP